ncbi:hypothetical protein [Spirosoma spitsbergense]|uniref:hypothetical protein n=1 Tax=Spirosoma spitsbergense TaxID=431554 RepID=UPI0003766195|nr:hypothetical protein [Spirosoma spitsbergense]
MKTIVRFRSVAFVLLLTTTLITACKKNNDAVAPDAAAQAAGSYTYSELTFNGQTLPASQTNLKGTITVARESAGKVSMDVNIRQKSDNSEFIVLSGGGVDVFDAGSGKLTFKYDGEQIGELNSNNLTINGVDDSNVHFTIGATK